MARASPGGRDHRRRRDTPLGLRADERDRPPGPRARGAAGGSARRRSARRAGPTWSYGCRVKLTPANGPREAGTTREPEDRRLGHLGPPAEGAVRPDTRLRSQRTDFLDGLAATAPYCPAQTRPGCSRCGRRVRSDAHLWPPRIAPRDGNGPASLQEAGPVRVQLALNPFGGRNRAPAPHCPLPRDVNAPRAQPGEDVATEPALAPPPAPSCGAWRSCTPRMAFP